MKAVMSCLGWILLLLVVGIGWDQPPAPYFWQHMRSSGPAPLVVIRNGQKKVIEAMPIWYEWDYAGACLSDQDLWEQYLVPKGWQWVDMQGNPVVMDDSLPEKSEDERSSP